MPAHIPALWLDEKKFLSAGAMFVQRVLSNSSSGSVVHAGVASGTPQFMEPEMSTMKSSATSALLLSRDTAAHAEPSVSEPLPPLLEPLVPPTPIEPELPPAEVPPTVSEPPEPPLAPLPVLPPLPGDAASPPPDLPPG